MSEKQPQEKKASEKIREDIANLSRTLTDLNQKVEALGKRPEIISPEDAKILRKHIDTCTEPGCPYKPIFPELAPEETEAPQEQARPEATETPGAEPGIESHPGHKPIKRWSVSDVGRRGRNEGKD